MPNMREIQKRIKSIKDTMKITNAMYMISQTKLRRARKALEGTEPYFYTLQSMLSRILRHLQDVESPFFDQRLRKPLEEKKRGLIVVTADKGMAGAYNHNILKMAECRMREPGIWKLYVVGEIGRHHFAHKGVALEEHFHYTAQNPSLHRARIISETVIQQFLHGELDEVFLLYTRMEGGGQTSPQALKLLPMHPDDFKDQHIGGIYREVINLQPDPKSVLKNIIPDCIMGYIYGALVESFCSEQNSRMLAMEAANKSAQEMISVLSIQFNRVRQAAITQEINEVVGGAKAQKKKKLLKQAGGAGR